MWFEVYARLINFQNVWKFDFENLTIVKVKMTYNPSIGVMNNNIDELVVLKHFNIYASSS